MTVHLNEDQLINYIYQLLPDAEREALDLHLSACPSCRTSLADHEIWQRHIHHAIAARRRVAPSSRMNYAAIAPRLKSTRRFTMVLKRSNQFVYGALTMALLVAVGVGLYFFLSNLSRPTPTTPDEVEQPAVPTVVSQPTINPTAEVSQPIVNMTEEVSQPTEFVMQITGDPNPLSLPADVAVDSAGNLYVVDGSNQRIQKFDRNGQFLTMWGGQGSGDGQFNFVLNAPYADGAVAVDGQGNVYVADTANKRIQKFDSNGQFLAKWGSSGLADGAFYSPTGIAVDKQSAVYVADFNRVDIQKFDDNGQFLTKFGGRSPEQGGLIGPSWLAVDAEGNVYVADDGTHQIHKFDQNGQFLTRWGGVDRFGGGPTDVTVDGQGNIYVNGDNPAVLKFDNQGRLLAEWGSPGSGEGQFNFARGVAVDAEGNVYVADANNNRVQKFRQPGWAANKLEEDSQPAADLTSTEAMFRGNPQHTGVYGDADIKGPELGEVKWQFKIGGSSTQSSPAVVNGLVYIGSSDKHVYAIDAETGQEKWKFETGSPVWSSPAVVEGVLYIGSNDHYLYALDHQTGQEKWKFETGAAVRSSPAVADGVVYVGSFDKNVYALDAQTGQEQWRFETEASIYSSPTVAAGVLYIGSGCDRADGCEGSRPYYLYALDSQTGQEKWRFEAGSTIESSPAVAAGLVYFGSIDGYLYAVDSRTGQEKWKFKTIDSVVSSPGVAAGVVYIGENNGYLYALDSQTGQEKWQFKVEDSLYTSPVVVAGVVYMGGADFNLYALDSQTGREKWKFATRNSVQSSPTVADGAVYVGSDDGYLYALQ
ncbi:MAG TPA: PQQ-binding-like beta-propeller repeat protein [Anaerolineae bacterium]|nr:PQQ-binding-like beta-propeller repeat protein [Anaerolineae bacterium]